MSGKGDKNKFAGVQSFSGAFAGAGDEDAASVDSSRDHIWDGPEASEPVVLNAEELDEIERRTGVRPSFALRPPGVDEIDPVAMPSPGLGGVVTLDGPAGEGKFAEAAAAPVPLDQVARVDGGVISPVGGRSDSEDELEKEELRAPEPANFDSPSAHVGKTARVVRALRRKVQLGRGNS